MVCAKCQKLSKGTTLATTEVKRKSEMCYGSLASASSSSSSKVTGSTKSTTLGQSGVGKVGVRRCRRSRCAKANKTQSKLLSKSAKNPYAQYSSSCSKCKTKISQGHSFCHTCAFKNDGKPFPVSCLNSFADQNTPACAMCGKPNRKTTSKAPVVSGQKFTLK